MLNSVLDFNHPIVGLSPMVTETQCLLKPEFYIYSTFIYVATRLICFDWIRLSELCLRLLLFFNSNY